jgi:preprotein translocase subunit SecE
MNKILKKKKNNLKVDSKKTLNPESKTIVVSKKGLKSIKKIAGISITGKKKNDLDGKKNSSKKRRLNPFRLITGLFRYIKSSILELRKVTWPTRSETIKFSISVFIFSAVVAAFIFAIDFGFNELFKKVFL